MKLVFFGHSCFKIVSEKGKKIIIDPWLTNPLSPKDADQGPYDYILITHAHGDHLGEALSLSKKGGEIIAIHEIQQYLLRKGATKAIGMNIGGTYRSDGISFTMVPALHSSSFPDGSYGGEPCGFVITLENGLTIYHAGDTGVFSDMKLIGELYTPEIALLPIGDHYVMGPKEAAKACELIRPKVIIPMHYGTFPVLSGKVEDLENEIKKYGLEIKIHPLKPGEEFNL